MIYHELEERILIDNEGRFIKNGKTYTGPMVKYYSNGSIESQAEVINGLIEGEAKIFYENKKIKEVSNFRANKLHGLYKRYYENGNLESKIDYKHGLRTGKYLTFYESGQLKLDVNIIDDLYEGVSKAYYEDGTLEYEYNYQNGAEHGKRKKFYPNGNLEFEISFENGKINGECKWYYKSGNLQKFKNGENGIYEGTAKEFYENGNLEKIYEFKKNLVVGNAIGYYENGNLWFEVSKYTGIKDILLGMDIGVDGIYKKYYENGNLQAYINCKSGEKNGECKWYYENGSLDTVKNYIMGVEHGIRKEFYENGELKSVFFCNNGIENQNNVNNFFIEVYLNIREKKLDKALEILAINLDNIKYDGYLNTISRELYHLNNSDKLLVYLSYILGEDSRNRLISKLNTQIRKLEYDKNQIYPENYSLYDNQNFIKMCKLLDIYNEDLKEFTNEIEKLLETIAEKKEEIRKKLEYQKEKERKLERENKELEKAIFLFTNTKKNNIKKFFNYIDFVDDKSSLSLEEFLNKENQNLRRIFFEKTEKLKNNMNDLKNFLTNSSKDNKELFEIKKKIVHNISQDISFIKSTIKKYQDKIGETKKLISKFEKDEEEHKENINMGNYTPLIGIVVFIFVWYWGKFLYGVGAGIFTTFLIKMMSEDSKGRIEDMKHFKVNLNNFTLEIASIITKLEEIIKILEESKYE